MTQNSSVGVLHLDNVDMQMLEEQRCALADLATHDLFPRLPGAVRDAVLGLENMLNDWSDKKASAEKQVPVRPHCPYCDDHEQQSIDALSVWDGAAQKWVLGETYDVGHCGNCETDSKHFAWKTIESG